MGTWAAKKTVAFLAGALCALTILDWTPRSHAADTSDGPSIYRVLTQRGLLENYFTEQLAEILGTLVKASGHWDTSRVNQPYRAGAVNAYLVDARTLPEPSVLAPYGIELDSVHLEGNAMANEETGILFVDTGFLKSLLTAAILVTKTDLDTIAAVGAIRARGIEAFRDIWDPKRNPALLQAGYADQWVLLASGAAAFALAHEMGHLALGRDDPRLRRVPMRFENDADADAHWACADLVQNVYRNQQEIEKAADDFAVETLAEVLFPEGVLTEPKLRFEVGAEWYIVYSLAEQMVRALEATESENIRRMLRIQFGPEVFAALDARKTQRGRGSIRVFFPEKHPANIRRASQSLSRLSRSPFSVAAATGGSSSQSEMQMLELIVAAECRNIKARQGDKQR